MSNSLAVAMVTAALRRLLGEALVGVPAGGVENAVVTTLRPDMLDDVQVRGVNVFLYQVEPSAAWQGYALPARRADGTPVTRPQQALELHYLLTFSGDENLQEPQRMLGAVMTALVAEPVLSRQRVRRVIADAQVADPGTWERFSDLPDQVDVVRFTPAALSLDDAWKLWSTFFRSAYRLSVAYKASAVLLDADLTPWPPLPVADRGITVAVAGVPVVTRVVAESETVLRVEGERLRGPAGTVVRVAGVEVPAADVTNDRLTVVVPVAVPAGLHALQVRHPMTYGDPPALRAGPESAAVPVLVRPRITGPVTVAPGGVTVPVSPPVVDGQRVVLLLNEDGGTKAYAFAAPGAAGDRVTVPVPGAGAGTFLVRVQVDGAQSLVGPRVVLP